jgi:hypothetical protein
MRAAQTALRKFFNGIEPFEGLGLDAAKSDYSWDLPRISFDGTPLHTNKTSFEANVELKTRLNEAWNANPDLRPEIAHWVVSSWGGIRGNQHQTLDIYCSRASREDPSTPLSGISSFSKILAIKDPDKYAIYDARVAVSLNAIQMIYQVSSGMAFPYVLGRNRITGDAASKPPRGFVYREAAKVKNLISAPYYWKRVPRDQAYARYLGLLRENARNIGVPLCHLEMTLFCYAPALACRVFPDLE